MTERRAKSFGRFPRRAPACHWLAASIIAGLAWAVASAPVNAQLNTQEEPVESFEIGLSTNRIGITADFNGAQLVVFGALDNADARIQRQQRYDIVVALFGPRAPVVVREKQPVLGIWVNQDSETFDAAPTTYSVASTRPFQDIASKAVRERLSLGIDSVRLSIADNAESEAGQTNRSEFEAALRRIRTNKGLYSEATGEVRFLGPSLFRADLRLPADLPVGVHTARAYLFRQGVLIRQSSQQLTVVKVGFEAWIDRFSEEHGASYGVLAVLLAVFTGWFGRVIFRRD
ncbi:MAG: TIGR02186 family protein [Fulvimarina manganoxydans]|uniref:TIGR02186 family protein n=1 Tax=Fulvimarina manganoxydans TaxID=937218 RepID=UPI002355A80F|nr:TIGR02186 family protein [Fulvimarina manganoxydans]MCK5931825.1 TIGR02186 family protein [Fulvimarina manganoxydans]